MARLHSCSFIISKKEKIEGKWVTGSSYVLNNLSKKTAQLRTIAPRADILVDYPASIDNQAKVHLDFFPYITGHISPYSGLLLRGQHHPITHLSPSYFIKIIETYIGMCQDTQRCSYEELENDLLLLRFTPVPLAPYIHTITEETSIIKLADSLQLNPYLIYELNNSDIKYDAPLMAGTSLTLPPYYADKAIFWLSKEHLLPIKVQFYKGNALYEEYQFSSYQLQWDEE